MTTKSIHTTVLRPMFEEKYAELIVNNTINIENIPDANSLTTIIMQHSDDIIALINNVEFCSKECQAFTKCIFVYKSYTSSIIMRYHMKQLYIDSLVEGLDPDDKEFEKQLVKRANSYEPIIDIIADHDDYSKTARVEQVAHEFLDKVNKGTVSVPVTRPYLNYVPTTLAKSILLKYVGA